MTLQTEGRRKLMVYAQSFAKLLIVLAGAVAVLALGFAGVGGDCGALAKLPPLTLTVPTSSPSETTAAPAPASTEVAAPSSTVSPRRSACRNKYFPHTGCVVDFMYVNVWAQFRPLSLTSWTFVDVGANKGYSIVALLQAVGITKYTSKGNFINLQNFANKEGLTAHVLCGACRDCKETFVPYGNRHEAVEDGAVFQKVKVYAFDPIRAHAKYLKSAFLSDEHVTVTVRQVALSNETGVATFGTEGNYLGREEMSLTSSASSNDTNVTSDAATEIKLYDVPVSTLTHELRDEKIDFIDVLLTDTEGNDFKVAEGAAEWIFAGRVGLYIFEIHRDAERNLGSHIRRLEKSGYRCYAPIQGGGATQISHECWNSKWDNVSGWINVICANERLPHLLEAMYTITTFLKKRPKQQ